MEWAEVIKNPLLSDLPFKIELNRFGKLLMTPASNKHGYLQTRFATTLANHMPQGKVITECSIQTAEGVKVADVAWASSDFIAQYGFETPYRKAPEICVEIVSPSNFKAEIDEKVSLYLTQGAHEVWIVYEDDKLKIFTGEGEVTTSLIAPDAQVSAMEQ